MISRPNWFGLAQQEDPLTSDVTVLGLPFDAGCCYRAGAAEAPNKIRELSRTTTAVSESGDSFQGLRVVDLGNIESSGNTEEYFRSIETWSSTVPREVFFLGLGGDHSVSLPLVRGFSKKTLGDCGLLWLDAHPDLWDVYDGNRLSHACVLRRLVEECDLNPKRIAVLGVRSFSEEEVDYLITKQILYITARDMACKGIDRAARSAIERIHEADSVYLSLDIDFLDPASAPGTGTPVGGGPSTRDALLMLDAFFQKLNIRAMDLVEICPPHDCSDITAVAGVQILQDVLGAVWTKKQKIRV